MKKIKVDIPVFVEGKYDKITLGSVIDAKIISLSGFGIFNAKEKQHLICRLAEKGGVILLTDSDAGGRQIRTFISGLVPKDKLFHIYIPQIEGKERRKSAPSKQGFLGVEGMEREVLEKLFLPFESKDSTAEKNERKITKTDFYLDGLTGAKNSALQRKSLSSLLGLPQDMSANALLDALNLLYGYKEYKEAISKI
jgi:ribonuclease M5